jgi:hypothetical protein
MRRGGRSVEEGVAVGAGAGVVAGVMAGVVAGVVAARGEVAGAMGVWALGGVGLGSNNEHLRIGHDTTVARGERGGAAMVVLIGCRRRGFGLAA